MALQTLHPGVTVGGKRKHPGTVDDAVITKRLRETPNPALPSPHHTSPSSLPLQNLIAELSPKYDIEALSVLSSTSIAKRVDSVLRHLGRFDPSDMTVLPGVTLLYARATTANKLITIVETVRRRIHEGEQKWYQYNRLYEVEWAAKQQSNSHNHNRNPQQSHKVETMVEDTVMSMDDGAKDSGDDDFEIMQPRQQTVFERAVHGEEKAKQMAHMSIFLSRIPIPELKAKENFAVQSNEEYISYVRRKKAGLA